MGMLRHDRMTDRPGCEPVTCFTLSRMHGLCHLQAVRLLRNQWQTKLVNLEDIVTGAEVTWNAFDIIMIITSTYGSGAPPSSATRQIQHLPSPCRVSNSLQDHLHALALIIAAHMLACGNATYALRNLLRMFEVQHASVELSQVVLLLH